MQVATSVFTMAFKRRLGCALAPNNASCRLRRARPVEDSDGNETWECGELMGTRATHSVACPRSGSRLRAHTACARGLQEELLAAGATVDIERYIPELYSDDGT